MPFTHFMPFRTFFLEWLTPPDGSLKRIAALDSRRFTPHQ